MGVNKSTWYLLGLASGAGGEAAKGFKLGWQYHGYDAIVRNINETHSPNAGGSISRSASFLDYSWTSRPSGGGGDGGHGGGGGESNSSLAWQIGIKRDGTVSITDEIKDAHEGLMECGVIFVFQWKNPSMCLGGKFEWIGKGDSEGEHHDVNKKNVVKKLEDPPGKTKQQNYWYEHGAKPGPYVVSKLLQKTDTDGGIIVTVGGLWKAMDWAHIPS